MKKSYLKKNVLIGVLTYLASGWEKKELSFIACEFHEPYHITSLAGDICYFTYTACPNLYDDFIIRFGSNISRETVQDIDLFRVIKKDGTAFYYKYEFTIRIEKKCLCAILAEVLLGIEYILK